MSEQFQSPGTPVIHMDEDSYTEPTPQPRFTRDDIDLLTRSGVKVPASFILKNVLGLSDADIADFRLKRIEEALTDEAIKRIGLHGFVGGIQSLNRVEQDAKQTIATLCEIENSSVGNED